MDIFSYFQADHAHIERRLHGLTVNYNNLSNSEVHEQAVRIFNAIKVHFDKQELLLLPAICHIIELKDVLRECRDDRQRILNEIEDMLNLHVDDPDFNQQMKHVLNLIEDHVRFSDRDLYESIKRHVPHAILDGINNKLDEAILS